MPEKMTNSPYSLRSQSLIIKRFFFVLFSVLFALSACNSSDVKDAVDVADGVDRKQIDYGLLGVNAFGNDTRFGTSQQQYQEVSNTLQIKRVRILMNWNDGVQASPQSDLNLSFYDSIVSSIPADVEILAVVTDLPSWMSNPANWVNGNPRETFVREFFSRLVARYDRVSAWQLWNEPNMASNPDNTTLDVQNSPANYVEMLAFGSNAISENAPGKLLINAATTSINQNFPETLDYNRGMRDAGAQSFISAWAIHYYGKQYENVVRSGGVADFLNGLGKPIWVTESGAQGVNSQLAYGETTWPFLSDKISGVDRIYIYQFAEATPSASTYGLRNLDAGAELSDLYINLRDR